MARDAAEDRRRARRPSSLPLATCRSRLAVDAGDHAVGALPGARADDDVEPGPGGDLGQARAHDPRADDADSVDLTHAAQL